MSLIHDQVKEILSTLSMAFDNFVEANFPSNLNNSNNTLLHRSPGKNIHRNQQALNYRVRKFNRPGGRRPIVESNNGVISSFNPFKMDTIRKRSWTVEDSLLGTGEEIEDGSTEKVFGTEDHGKRSKSLILLEEVDSITEALKNQASFKMDEDYHTYTHTHSNPHIHHINNFTTLLQEINRYDKIDEILTALSTIPSSSTPTTFYLSSSFNHWLKWRVMLKLIEASESCKGVKINLCRANLVSKSFDHLTQMGLINWFDDPEFIFLFLRFMSILLHSTLSSHSTTPHSHNTATTLATPTFLIFMRRMEEFNGIGKFLTFFVKNCIKFISASKRTFQFLLTRPDSSNQILVLLESLLEVNLTIFETFTILQQQQQQSSNSQSQHLLKIIVNFLIISLKFFEFLVQESAADDSELIKKFICRIKLLTVQ